MANAILINNRDRDGSKRFNPIDKKLPLKLIWAAILKQNRRLVGFFRHKHGIAIAKEAIFLRDSMLIRRHHMIKTGKSAD